MAKSFIAIDTQKNVFEFSKKGIDLLKDIHKNQKIQGWQYGSKSQKDDLLKNIVTPKEAKAALEENARLKAELEALKSVKPEKQK